MAMRTNIIIDNEIMRAAMKISGIRTKKGVIEQAMREFVARHIPERI
jgi:Arc/MetJ family transcription regulator